MFDDQAVERVARLMGRYAAGERLAEQCKVAQKIQKFVTNELVRESPRIQKYVLADDNRVS